MGTISKSVQIEINMGGGVTVPKNS